MEKRMMTGPEIAVALKRNGVTQGRVARLAGVSQPLVSQALSGWLPLDEEKKARLEAAFSQLGLARDVPDANTPTFEISVESTNE